MRYGVTGVVCPQQTVFILIAMLGHVVATPESLTH